ncbi:MAG: hypothetical protein ACLUOS_13925 [Odoribacter splanchnicus]
MDAAAKPIKVSRKSFIGNSCTAFNFSMAMANTFADRIVEFNRNLHYTGELPEGFQVMNPYLDNPETLQVMEQFTGNITTIRTAQVYRRNQPSRHGAE